MQELNQTRTAVALQVVEMQQKLVFFGEMERVLKQRNAHREACRYLLEARKLLVCATPLEPHAFETASYRIDGGNQLSV